MFVFLYVKKKGEDEDGPGVWASLRPMCLALETQPSATEFFFFFILAILFFIFAFFLIIRFKAYQLEWFFYSILFFGIGLMVK